MIVKVMFDDKTYDKVGDVRRLSIDNVSMVVEFYDKNISPVNYTRNYITEVNILTEVQEKK